MDQINITLKKVGFTEKKTSGVNTEIRPVSLGELSVLLGDNGQGKTRLFGFLRFTKEIHAGVKPGFPDGEQVDASFEFDVDGKQVLYKFSVKPMPDGVTPTFDETITKDGDVLFSRSQSKLFDEAAGKYLLNFFLPANTPALTALAPSPQFETLYVIKNFLERMCFLEANRLDASNIEIAQGAMFLNYKGRNASSVLETWKSKIKPAYEEILERFEEIFPFVKKQTAKVSSKVLPGMNIQAPLLSYVDSDSGKEFLQTLWSDGLLRTICLLILPATRFLRADGFDRPTLIFVDEVENGLDFNTLRRIVEIYKDYSIHTQVILSSHSPTICNLIGPESWRIAKRKGFVIEIFAPKDIESDLDEQRKQLLDDNWEFYKRHISKSHLYSVK